MKNVVYHFESFYEIGSIPVIEDNPIYIHTPVITLCTSSLLSLCYGMVHARTLLEVEDRQDTCKYQVTIYPLQPPGSRRNYNLDI